jgi:polar amino acid transport system substrate-binding protein
MRKFDRQARRPVGVVAAALLVSSLLAACGGGSAGGSDDLSGETVKMGVAVLPPFVIKDGDDVTGDTPEIARAVLERMGVSEVETVLVDFDGLIPGLQAGRYDLIAGALSITPDRCEAVAFTRPYVASPTAFAVKEGNPEGLERYEDFVETGATLGIIGGGTTVQATKSAGIPDSQIQTYPDILAGLQALETGRIDAFSSDPISLIFSVEESDISGVEVTDQFVEQINGKDNPGAAGFVFRKDDTEFRDSFDEQLGEIGPDGLAEIGAQFGIPAESYTLAAEYTAEELCAP